MRLGIQFLTVGVLLGSMAWGQQAAAVAEKPKKEITVFGWFDIQAKKDAYDNNSDNNLDQFFGRLNFGANMKGDNVSGRINIRAFPAGFGYEVLTGVSYDTTGAGAVTAQKSGVARFLVESAWMQYNTEMGDFKVGRYFVTNSQTFTYGNYLHQNAGGSFMTKLAYHNAIEHKTSAGPWNSSIMLSAGDKNLNTGSLRVFQSLAIGEVANIGAGYFSNVFDLFYDSDATIKNRYTVLADAKIKDFNPYVEVGIYENEAGDGQETPVHFGIKLPSAGLLDVLALEGEYSTEEKRKDKPVTLGVFMDKRFNPHLRFLFGVSNSTVADGEFTDVTVSLRYMGYL